MKRKIQEDTTDKQDRLLDLIGDLEPGLKSDDDILDAFWGYLDGSYGKHIADELQNDEFANAAIAAYRDLHTEDPRDYAERSADLDAIHYGKDMEEDADVGQIEKVGPEGVTIASKDPANKIKQIVPQTSLVKDPTGKLILNKAATGAAAGAPGTPAAKPEADTTIKPGAEVAVVSDESISPNSGSESPISGDEAEDNLTTRLKKLAGLL